MRGAEVWSTKIVAWMSGNSKKGLLECGTECFLLVGWWCFGGDTHRTLGRWFSWHRRLAQGLAYEELAHYNCFCDQGLEGVEISRSVRGQSR